MPSASSGSAPFIERADNTARILDVKYHVLLPETEQVGGYVDYYQWGALLRSVGAFRAYRRVYHDTVYPWRIAELLILRADMPRSLHHCYGVIINTLDELAGKKQLECRRLAGQTYARLRYWPPRQDLPVRPARVPDRFHRPE
jgi:uncharacterized alpha-E superfamily protein